MPETRWDGRERRQDVTDTAGPMVEWLTRLESELAQVRESQLSNYRFFKRAGGVFIVLFGLTAGYFVWVTRNVLISERELPRIEAKMDVHMSAGGHNGTNEQLSAIAVELRYLRDDVNSLKRQLEERDRAEWQRR